MQINWITLLIALLGALKLILQPFGVEITDDHINAIVNGASAVVTVAGVIYHHMKNPNKSKHPFDGGVDVGNSKPTNPIGSSK